jgi:hypothetical protein
LKTSLRNDPPQACDFPWDCWLLRERVSEYIEVRPHGPGPALVGITTQTMRYIDIFAALPVATARTTARADCRAGQQPAPDRREGRELGLMLQRGWRWSFDRMGQCIVDCGIRLLLLH